MELTTSWRVATLLTLALVLLSMAERCDADLESIVTPRSFVFRNPPPPPVSHEPILGRRTTCDLEGEEIPIDKLLNSSCFTCMCKNGYVDCRKPQCPNLEGCYALLESNRQDCCQQCNGCVKNGKHHESGTEWTEPSDPCKLFMCKAGVITEAKMRCYTPCSNPKPPLPGQCCPTCPGCYVNGQKVPAESSVTITEDPCVTCKCTSGKLVCSKQVCPVHHCPNASLTMPPSECCPQCRGSGKFFQPWKGECLLGGVVPSGQSISFDKCTQCSCSNSVLTCVKETCPVLECPSNYLVSTPGRCCPQCAAVEKSRTACTHGGKTYENGESWQLDVCKTCECKHGQVRCAMPRCLSKLCPPNSRLEHLKGQCCPQCIESDGVCTVFGDPHYRTFDGKVYSFDGYCKYHLVSDCVQNTFNIRVVNARRSPNAAAALTKAVVLKMGKLRINLGQRMRVKVNKKKVGLPFHFDRDVEIARLNDTVVVKTDIGIKVTWDGRSFVEVEASSVYRGKLCGLCGNFNSVPRDDLIARGGRLMHDREVNIFAESWIVNSSKRHCNPKFGRPRYCNTGANKRYCSWLKSDFLAPCEKKLNPQMYYNACIDDMCNCPRKKCYCQSYMAYVHECRRLGVQVADWRNATACQSF